MDSTDRHTIQLQAEQLAYVESLVDQGRYASAAEVVQAGLLALQDQDGSVDAWLREDVAPVYDAMQRNPSRAITAERVLTTLQTHHEERLKYTRAD